MKIGSKRFFTGLLTVALLLSMAAPTMAAPEPINAEIAIYENGVRVRTLTQSGGIGEIIFIITQSSWMGQTSILIVAIPSQGMQSGISVRLLRAEGFEFNSERHYLRFQPSYIENRYVAEHIWRIENGREVLPPPPVDFPFGPPTPPSPPTPPPPPELPPTPPPQPLCETLSDWAAEQVAAAIEQGLVPQNLQSNYTQAITRAEFAALVVYLCENQRSEITGRRTFDDTDDVNVQKAAYIGVVQGVGENLFAPDNPLTREQAAVMLSRLAGALGQPLPQQAATFADYAQVSYWAIDAVGQMQASGIMGGVGENLFAPGDPYTREQSIVTIMRLFDIMNAQ